MSTDRYRILKKLLYHPLNWLMSQLTKAIKATDDSPIRATTSVKSIKSLKRKVVSWIWQTGTRSLRAGRRTKSQRRCWGPCVVCPRIRIRISRSRIIHIGGIKELEMRRFHTSKWSEEEKCWNTKSTKNATKHKRHKPTKLATTRYKSQNQKAQKVSRNSR